MKKVAGVFFENGDFESHANDWDDEGSPIPPSDVYYILDQQEMKDYDWRLDKLSKVCVEWMLKYDALKAKYEPLVACVDER